MTADVRPRASPRACVPSFGTGDLRREQHCLPAACWLGISGWLATRVAAAIDQLAAEGYLLTRRGCRPRVAPGLIGIPLKTDRTGSQAIAPSAIIRIAEEPAAWPAGRACLADAATFPYELWASCLRDAARRMPRGELSDDRPSLQNALCEHLAEFRGVRAEPGKIVLVPTAQAGLSLIANALLARGERAWIEEPGYPGIRAALAGAGAVIVPVTVDDQGLTVPEGDAPRLIFATPSHHYPTGRLMPVGRRHALLAAAARHGAVVVEDDYDGEFHYDGAPVPSLQGLDDGGRVVYVGTFAKATTPDIWVGYLVVPPGLREALDAVRRGWGLIVPPHVQEALGLFLKRGLYRAHVRRMRRLFRARRDGLAAALAARGADVFAVERSPGGLQLMVMLRHGGDDVALAADASSYGISVTPLWRCFAGPPAHRGLLIGLAALGGASDPDRAIETLCALA
ncbi:UNVERIFIED_ORG: GntR family transcriptional regulator/MocR family aminotransferase [Methylobacterium sp. SuP10 SLI 274]|uniref:aminotransferase-like domain-containing protein n=1 Tax=Methylorubrum extorquens TaxID=408 RepID=UPI00209E5008|nr:PLP-dependent aminotransferase family protein [Methylorubrum extorquens]MDF9861141.1 GntR family transcriptional regulator/MocR family aminotransferase [Methylorubrum pseudosasae]MDH6640029.1 GntR family transcriptional regulator/MocR family aminotransferase [Methylobacterium sp. SuP10 SLI 274]MDH6669214.1 GntR family transcriptional regulator/MocR family aminotransferase [Methylorubrum zatmanii]MCP1556773.1 GntR family transcriptional regulator/MocR family aminotransferase [Methylorubrum ex